MKTAQVIMETGNQAAALAVKYARVDVVPATQSPPRPALWRP